jgi:hypothetical protein
MNKNPDVLVVGAGSAGVAAAVAAARQGAKVLVLERYSFAGGKATGAEVGTICGLHHFSKSPESRYACDGFAVEFAEKLRKLSGTGPMYNTAGLHYLPYRPFDFKLLCDEYLGHENITMAFHSTVSGVEMDGDKIKAVNAIVFDRSIRFEPAVVIDCSGESIVSSLAVAELIEENSYQAAAQVFSFSGCTADDEAKLGMSLIKSVMAGINSAELDSHYDRVTIVPGSLRDGSVMLKIGLPGVVDNDENKSTKLEIEARKIVARLAVYLSQNLEPFATAQLSSVAVESGIRTGRRPKGKYILSAEDVLACKKFEDSAAIGCWPIEMWGQDKRVRMKYFAENDFYTISVDCLRSASISNLLFAGRNISATEEAIASARVIGTCLQTGFTAGELATKMLS